MNVYFIIILFSLTKILTAWQNLKWNLFKIWNEIFSKLKMKSFSLQRHHAQATEQTNSEQTTLYFYILHLCIFTNEERVWFKQSIQFFPYIFTYYIFFLSHNKRKLRATEFTTTMKLLQLKDIFYIIQLRGGVRVHLRWTRDSVQSRMMYPNSLRH